MANILSRYGIKEVADVTFYKINNDESQGAPVLYLDTLKVSTIEQTAENAEARGGKGNAALISWDYGKEITVTLEDALYSPKSLALIYGDQDANPETVTGTIKKTIANRKGVTLDVSYDQTTQEILAGAKATVNMGGKDVILNNCVFYDANGNILKKDVYLAAYITGDMTVTGGYKIDISANSFPGVYRVVGDTYARNEATGRDEFFQFVIPKAKIMSESNTITMEAEGDPTVFSMNLKVLRPRDGVMMQLIQYEN